MTQHTLINHRPTTDLLESIFQSHQPLGNCHQLFMPLFTTGKGVHLDKPKNGSEVRPPQRP